MTDVDAVHDHIWRNAADWYPSLGSRTLRVSLLSDRRRRRSRLIRFEVGDGQRHVTILCKIATPPETAGSTPSRPRLGEPDDARRKLPYEYAALRAMRSRIATDDPRIAAVRPLDLMEEQGVLLMEEEPSRTLRDLLVDAARPGASDLRRRLPDLFMAVGAWLGEFHRLDLPSDGTRRASAVDHAGALRKFADWLTDRGAPSELVSRAVETATQDAPSSDLRTGPVHGDAAPRNVLVGRDGRVMMIDPLARWRVPVWDDLAYMLASLRVNRLSVLTAGRLPPRSTLATLESAFLAGHPHGDMRRVRASLVLILLDRWAAGLAPPHPTGPARDLFAAMERRRIAAELCHLLRDEDDYGTTG